MKFNSKMGIVLSMLFLVLLLTLPFASAKVVSPRSFWSQNSTINGAAIPIGSNVTAYDPDEVLCGSFTVTVLGGYGFLDCQGDDPDTSGVDEGAVSGDTIAFYINGDIATAVGDTTWAEGGTVEVNLTATNSKPSISEISGLSGTVKGNSSQIVTATTTDPDHVKSSTKDQLRLIICSTNSASDNTGCAATTYCNGTLVSSFSPTCTFNVILDDATHNYYAFVMDEHGALSLSSQSGSYISDSTAPNITTVNPANNSWVNSTTKEITVTTDEDATCKNSTTNGTAYSSKTAMTGTGTSHTATLTLSNEGSNNTFYFQCNDTVGNLMNLSNEYHYNLKRDTIAPNASLATITIESGASYSTNTTLDFTWFGFNDSVASSDVSGIEGYYYNFTNNENTSTGTWDTSSPGILYNAPQGLITIYIWAKDVAGNIGLAVNDSIIVDNIPPSVSIFNVSETAGQDYLYYDSSATTLYYSNVDASNFSIQVAASDAISGLANVTGSSAFADSPTDTINKSGNYQYELNYTLNGNENFEGNIIITVTDNATNSNSTNLTVIRDITLPNIPSPDDSFEGWNSDNTPAFSWSDPGDNNGSGVKQYKWSIDLGANTTTSLLSVTLGAQADGNHTFYIYSQDNVGNWNNIAGVHSFAIDTTLSSTPTNITDEGVYSTTGNYTITWNASFDNLSGISVYELFESYDDGVTWTSVDDSITILNKTITGKQDGENYTYKVRARNGAGLWSDNSTVSDSILVDKTAPSYLNWQNTLITEDSAVNITVNVTITETASGLASTPRIRYKYGDDAWSSFNDIALVVGNNYTFTIPMPSPDWHQYRGENVSWQVNVSDNAGNIGTSSIQTELVDSYNHAPVLGTIQNYTVNEDELLEFNITATDSDTGDTLTYTSNESNITITKMNNTFATVSWTANNSYVGNNSIIFTVTDNGAGTKSDNQTIIIEVLNVNDAPYFDPALVNLTAYEDTAFSYDINATDIDPTGDTLNFSSNSSLFTINSTTGIISFTPTTAEIGVYYINITVSDNNNGSTSEVIQFSVLNKYSNITFYTRDRILQTELNNVTVVGNGASCNSPGCVFNFTTTIKEENANLQFIFSKTGFANNISDLSISVDVEFNITMDDNENPVINLVNISGRADGSTQYYIDIIANVTDNLEVANVTLNYDFADGSFLNTTGVFSNRTDGLFNLSLGPFTESKQIYSETFSEDYYSNNATFTNLNWWFEFVNGELNVALPPLILTKNIDYLNQTNRTVTYYVETIVQNTRISNITGALYSETESGYEVVNQEINIEHESNYTANYTVVINKQESNHEHTFGLASVMYNSTVYKANRPSVLIPGYGLGPFDIEVLSISDQDENGNFNVSVTLYNTNTERGGDFVVNWWIKDNSNTVSSGTKTVLILAGQTVTTTINAAAPSSAKTYTFEAQVEADSNAASERSFNVIAPAGDTPSGGGSSGGGGTGAAVTTPTPVEEVTEVVEEEISEKVPEEVEGKIPKQLLDIRLELEANIIEHPSELVAGIEFKNFGTEPAIVDLTYIILDESETEVYREKGSVIVETKQFVSRSFKELKLPYGEYTLVLRTLYNVDVEDEFRQEFVVKEEKKALFEMPSPVKCKLDGMWWIVLVVILLVLFIYESLKIDKHYTVSEKRRAKLKIKLTLLLLALTAAAGIINLFFYCLPRFIFYIFCGLTLINIIVLSCDKIRKKKHVSTNQDVIKHLKKWKPKTEFNLGKTISCKIFKLLKMIFIIIILFGVLYAVYKLMLKIINVLSNITTLPIQETPASLITLLLAMILVGIIILIIIAAVILVFVIKIYRQNKQKSFTPISPSERREDKAPINKESKKPKDNEKVIVKKEASEKTQESSIEKDMERLEKYGFKVKGYVKEPKLTISKKTKEITRQKIRDFIQKQTTLKTVVIQKPVIVKKLQLKIKLPKGKLRIKKIKSKKVDLGLIQSIYLNVLNGEEGISKNFGAVKKESALDSLSIKEKMLKQLNEVYNKEVPKWEKQ